MQERQEGTQHQQVVRVDFVPKNSYLSREFARLERERLWPKVWQVACREEEIPRVGDYVTYDICDESVIVVRTAEDRIQAFHNACQHRGRRLVEGCGHKARFVCKFHGWTWHVDGRLAKVLDHEDWEGCPEMAEDDLRLPSLQVDTWQGFVFVNFDEQCETLAKFLEPMPAFCDNYEFGKMRFWWYKSVRLPCNWKVALEAFNEGYHVAATHPQLLDTIGDDRTTSFAHGRHGMFGYFEPTRPIGSPSPRTGKPIPEDLRPGMVGYLDELARTLKAVTTWRDNAATRRLLTETSAQDDALVLMAKMQQFQKEAAEAEGAGWAPISFEEQYKAGQDWHVFPNMIFLPYPDGALFYRARPDGDNPDSCIYDIWSLARFAPGAEPTLDREMYYGDEDWKVEAHFGKILTQDFSNMCEVQRGMKSSGFRGSRTNPKQERAVSNFHRALHEALGIDARHEKE
jgi:phenylpropionate dioxygenase-like ring-hydroxylating dioxygenase large terminal subunit